MSSLSFSPPETHITNPEKSIVLDHEECTSDRLYVEFLWYSFMICGQRKRIVIDCWPSVIHIFVSCDRDTIYLK
jgi:hypothetical protein